MRARFMILALAALSMVTFVFGAADAGRGAAAQSTVTVEVGDFWFCSPGDGACQTTDSGDIDVTNTINVGDTVNWTVSAGFHTVSECDETFSDSGCAPTASGFDSGQLSQGQAFSRIFDAPGTFEYRCNNHPSQMRGSINVAAQATPTVTAGQTPSPAPTGAASPVPTQTVAPAAVPSTGGESGGGGASWYLLAALVGGGVVLIASSGVGVAILRRR